MRKFLLFLAPLFLLIPQMSFAAEINMADNYALTDQISIQDNLVVTADTIQINGQVQNDMFAAGREISISGQVNGDLIAAGKTILLTPTSKIGKSVRLAGGIVTLTGDIHQDVSIFANEVHVNGHISGNVRISANQVDLASIIDGSVKIEAENIVLKPNTQISGDFKYSSPNEPQIAKSASITGQKVIIPSEQVTNPYTSRDFWLHLILGTVAYWLIALLLLAFFPIAVQQVGKNFQEKFLPSLGIGLLSIIVGLIICAVFFLTIIGIPMGIIGVFIISTLIYLSQIPAIFFLTQLIGKIQFAQEHNRLQTALLLLASTFIISLVGIIPYIGSLLKLIIAIAGVGTVIITKKALYQELRKKELI